ncbi:AraC family transcriptional regulator [Chitinophaga sancti]|uniref:AraC family transcriptional regulator n=1 Tax=Chitinophaga sancti TaxID=1004 RepID=A0A1K1R0H7_9BACT|nr:AraC family transcriptional regulator [Chitinophaga sancti]WQD62104.1 AraC family transcriptional regulator [Chitinophaga sancti]WQG92327.1 AraC family transcriptional regulator [Chitinophaga sancti]SFW65070.1 AraC-type DNA-binding protein [Chitinophaga sancti]
MFTVYNIEDFPSDRVVKGQFMMERFEDLQRPPNLKWPHKHNFYEILWLTSGKSTNVIDYHQTIVQPYTLFFISPGQLHLMSRADKVKGYSITFTEEFLLLTANNKERLLALSFLDNSYTAPYLKLNATTRGELEGVLQMLEAEVLLAEKSAVIIGHLLFTLLNKIQRIIDGKKTTTDHSNIIRFKKFRHLIEENYKTEKTLAFYAGHLAFTPHRLNEICKEVSGNTAGEIIRERLLLEAKRLLIHSDLTVGEIANELGYEDISYFSRQFREKESVTPSQYRKSMYQKYQNL